MENCGMSFIKYVLFIFNFLFAISGLGILIAGIVVLTDVHEFDHFTEGRAIGPPIVLIVAGALVFLIASLGCYGAMKESPTLLMIYAVCLLVIVIVEVAVGIASVVMKSDMEMILNDSLRRSIIRSSKDDIIAWDNVQRKLKCCGVNGPADWVDLSANRTLRGSCCLTDFVDPATRDCKLAYPLFKDKYYQDGCVMKLNEKIASNAVILIGVAITIGLLQISGIVLACWLASAIRRENAK